MSIPYSLTFLEIMKTLPMSLVLGGEPSSFVLVEGVNPVCAAVLIGNLPQTDDDFFSPINSSP